MLGIKSKPLFMNNSFDHFPKGEASHKFAPPSQIKTMLEDVFAFVGTLDSDGIVLSLSGRIFKEISLNTEYLIGQKLSETVFWQSSEYTPKILQSAIDEAADGKKSKVVLDFRLSAERKLSIEFNVYPAEKGTSGEIFFCGYDVTEQEKLIDFHKQRGEQLLFAAESAEIGLWSWDLADNSVYSTPKCNELFEISSFDIINYDLFIEIVHPEDRKRVEDVLQHSQNYGTEYNEQFRVIYSNGDIEWISARGKTFLDSVGNPTKMMGVVRNITEQKKTEQALADVYASEKKARDEAEDANRSKDFFLAFVSHELRSPLNAILGWSKILLGKKIDESTQKNALETIERSARSQAKLINDLVDSARITSGKLRLELCPVNVFEIVSTVYNSQKPTAEAKNISFELSSSQDKIAVFGDSNRLQQVFNNLISNSLKFTPEGGKIVISLETNQSSVTIRVTDNGQGIKPESLPNIFRQFSQGEEKLTQDKGGLGLGLSIVKILVEKHKGKVSADSQGIGHGATFSVELPLYELTELAVADCEDKEVTGDRPLRGIKILLVEDDNDSREVLELFLQQSGAKVASAESAKTAMMILESAENNLPDVIISDLAMPEEDGYSLINRIRQLSAQNGGKVPAIALSAFATKENKQKAFELGFNKYDTKPFEPDLLVKDIVELAHIN
jgi:PAS domain S-box-containing protein